MADSKRAWMDVKESDARKLYLEKPLDDSRANGHRKAAVKVWDGSLATETKLLKAKAAVFTGNENLAEKCCTAQRQQTRAQATAQGCPLWTTAQTIGGDCCFGKCMQICMHASRI